jgi:hypothetical protein
MVRTSGRGRRRSGFSDHDHEWTPVKPADLVFDPEQLAVHQDCEVAEILESTVCDRRDETFHRYGRECQAVRQTTLRVSTLTFDDGREVDVDDVEALEDSLRERIASLTRAAANDSIEVRLDVCGPAVSAVHLAGTELTATFEPVETNVEKGGF